MSGHETLAAVEKDDNDDYHPKEKAPLDCQAERGSGGPRGFRG